MAQNHGETIREIGLWSSRHFLGLVYFTGNKFMSTFLKHRGRLALAPEAFEHRLIVTQSFDFFLPSAVFSKLAARVTSGSSRKFNAVSSQLKIWLREIIERVSSQI